MNNKEVELNMEIKKYNPEVLNRYLGQDLPISSENKEEYYISHNSLNQKRFRNIEKQITDLKLKKSDGDLKNKMRKMIQQVFTNQHLRIMKAVLLKIKLTDSDVSFTMQIETRSVIYQDQLTIKKGVK